MPKLPVDKAKELVQRRHAEWTEHHTLWSFLADSLEGGPRYKTANYACGEGLAPVRNLLRHPREVPPPMSPQQVKGAGDTFVNGNVANLEAAAQSTYDLRLARTPAPTFVSEIVEKYLSQIYEEEIKREGPKPVVEWWEDVDGEGSSIDEWMSETVAPLLIALGCLDLHFDHPPAPDGDPIETMADLSNLGLDKVIAGIILPDNMIWWRLNLDGTYAECLVQEWHDGAKGPVCLFRHWTAEDSAYYDHDGRCCKPDGNPEGGEVYPHPFGRVPIRRVFLRKKWRTKNVGMTPMVGVAEKGRNYYNRNSELILNDVMQAAPPLQGPVDMMMSNSEIVVGPGYMIPMFKDGSGKYQGSSYLTMDKSADESIRMNMEVERDEIDREAGITKPAGAVGMKKGTVAQSGVSKQIDQKDGSSILGKLVKALAKVERKAVEFAMLVFANGNESEAEALADDAEITYPTGFNLNNAQEQFDLAGQYQSFLSGTGQTPEDDKETGKRLLRQKHKGLAPERLAALDSELELYIDGRAADEATRREAGPLTAMGLGGSSPGRPPMTSEVVGPSEPGPGPGTATLNPLAVP